MSRRELAGIVTRESEVVGKPPHSISITCGEVWVFQKMLAKGKQGVTCRDFLGADLRHYIRNLKNKGIGIDYVWEKDAFSRHKRWRLRDGHTFENTCNAEKTKASTAATVKLSNSNANSEECEGSNV